MIQIKWRKKEDEEKPNGLLIKIDKIFLFFPSCFRRWSCHPFLYEMHFDSLLAVVQVEPLQWGTNCSVLTSLMAKTMKKKREEKKVETEIRVKTNNIKRIGIPMSNSCSNGSNNAFYALISVISLGIFLEIYSFVSLVHTILNLCNISARANSKKKKNSIRSNQENFSKNICVELEEQTEKEEDGRKRTIK